MEEKNAIQINLICPYCEQREEYKFQLKESVISDFPDFTNLGHRAVNCRFCSCDFLAHISYGLKTEILIRRIEPESLSLIDNEEYILDKNGIAQKNTDVTLEMTEDFDPDYLYEE